MSIAHVIHLTDLFHPHGDRDDHYDLATVFALHKLEKIVLERVMIDYPPVHRKGDPALCAVAQLNAITGSDVPVGVAPKDSVEYGKRLVEYLRKAQEKIIFTVVGSSAGLADAIRLAPEVFEEKCAGIYLNAGVGVQTAGGEREFNVRLNAAAYASIFSAPCPVYWLPCYHTIAPGMVEKSGKYGTCWCIEQKEILSHLSERMQNYFIYMMTQSSEPKYLRYLEENVDQTALKEYGEKMQRLWCTAGFLHIGKIECKNFIFAPVQITCNEDGDILWNAGAGEGPQRYMFQGYAEDRESDHSFDRSGAYRQEMLENMKELFAKLH